MFGHFLFGLERLAGLLRLNLRLFEFCARLLEALLGDMHPSASAFNPLFGVGSIELQGGDFLSS